MAFGGFGESLISLLDQAEAERLELLPRGREDPSEQGKRRAGRQDQVTTLGAPDQQHPVPRADGCDLGAVGKVRRLGKRRALIDCIPPRIGQQPLA